jgi:hypothetical protein
VPRFNIWSSSRVTFDQRESYFTWARFRVQNAVTGPPGNGVDPVMMNASSFSQAALSYSQIAHNFPICTSEMTIKFSIIILAWSLGFRAPSTCLSGSEDYLCLI